jgi:hypothetical protein
MTHTEEHKEVEKPYPTRIASATVKGLAVGALYGAVISSVKPTPAVELPDESKFIDPARLNRFQPKVSPKEAFKSIIRSSTTFGLIVGSWSIGMCFGESVRGQRDYWNGVWGAGFAGAAMTLKSKAFFCINTASFILVVM